MLGSNACVAASAACQTAAVVAINSSNQNLYRWVRHTPTTGSFSSAKEVGTNWSEIRLIASDSASGDLFAIHDNGNLYRYNFGDSAYGGGESIGQGWSEITQLIPAGNGVLYAVNSNGSLYWYRWLGSTWAKGSGTEIGPGWGQFSKVFSGGKGVLYAIDRDSGELKWYRHTDPTKPHASFAGPKTIGQGWNDMRTAVGLGGGVIYAINSGGVLLSYQHTDPWSGSAAWANSGKGTQIGPGWDGYDQITANPNACPTDFASGLASGGTTDPGTGTKGGFQSEPVGSSNHVWDDCVKFYGSTVRDKRYQAHGQAVHIDSVGRPDLAFKAWQYYEPIRKGHDNTKCQRDVGNWGNADDQGGHLIADSLGGWGGRANLVPQNGAMNTGIWNHKVEDTVRRCVKSGLGVNYTVSALYLNDTVRPASLEAMLFVYAGENVYQSQVHLANRSPTSLERNEAQRFSNDFREVCPATTQKICDNQSTQWMGTDLPPCVELSGEWRSAGSVRAVSTTAYYATKLQSCTTAGSSACRESEWRDVQGTVTTGNVPLTMWSRISKYGSYRACVKKFELSNETHWRCMWNEVYAGD
jgi:hypothetical protein